MMTTEEIIALQAPLENRFHQFTDASEVMQGIDLAGQTAIVTGGNSGVGFGVAQALVQAGARVVLPTRSREKTEKAMAAIGGDCVAVPMDLADFDSIFAFADEFAKLADRLPLLFNVAGCHTPPRSHTNGVETTLGSCLLGHLVLTRLLRDALARADGARVVFVSSCAHKDWDEDWDDINFEKRPWDAHGAYIQANAFRNLAVRLLQDLWGELGIRFNSVHPGYVMSCIMRNFSPQQMIDIGLHDENGSIKPERLNERKSESQGAAPVLFAAFGEGVNPGAYIDEILNHAELVGETTPPFRGVAPQTLDLKNARRMAVALQDLAPDGFDLFF